MLLKQERSPFFRGCSERWYLADISFNRARTGPGSLITCGKQGYLENIPHENFTISAQDRHEEMLLPITVDLRGLFSINLFAEREQYCHNQETCYDP